MSRHETSIPFPFLLFSLLIVNSILFTGAASGTMDDDYIFDRLDMLGAGQQRQAYDEQHDGGGEYPPYDNYAHQYANDNAFAGGYEPHDEFVQKPLQLDDIGKACVAIGRTYTHMEQIRDFSTNLILTLVMDKLRWGGLDCLCRLQKEAPTKLMKCINHPPWIRRAHHSLVFLTLHSTLVITPTRHHPHIGLQARHGVCPSTK